MFVTYTFVLLLSVYFVSTGYPLTVPYFFGCVCHWSSRFHLMYLFPCIIYLCDTHDGCSNLRFTRFHMIHHSFNVTSHYQDLPWRLCLLTGTVSYMLLHDSPSLASFNRWGCNLTTRVSDVRVRHVTGPFPVSPVPVLAGEVAHRYGSPVEMSSQ